MDGETAIYLDTSGVLAFLNADDESHELAKQAWREVAGVKCGFVMTDYVRLECWSLVQRRLGIEAVSDFSRHILPLCQIEVVGEAGFELLSRQVMLMKRKKLSLVDLSSFECMQRLKLDRALAFDKHFVEQGFITPAAQGW